MEAIERVSGLASIAKKLCAAMKMVKRVEKRGRNEFHRYSYAKEEDVAEEVRDAMAQAGLALIFDIQKMDMEERHTSKGGTTYLTTLHIAYSLVDSEEGATYTFRMIGQAMDDQDKGVYKALTGAQKYVYLKLLMIGTGDDPEDEKAEKAAPARGAMPSGFRPGDPATHTNVRTSQPPVKASPAPVAKPPAKPSLARPTEPELGPPISDEEWGRQMEVWNEDPRAAELVLQVKQDFKIHTTAELTERQRFGFMVEMERRLRR